MNMLSTTLRTNSFPILSRNRSTDQNNPFNEDSEVLTDFWKI
ncbi:MAG: hypothetical protein WBA16_01790 [Nonlabens sp.]